MWGHVSDAGMGGRYPSFVGKETGLGRTSRLWGGEGGGGPE